MSNENILKDNTKNVKGSRLRIVVAIINLIGIPGYFLLRESGKTCIIFAVCSLIVLILACFSKRKAICIIYSIISTIYILYLILFRRYNFSSSTFSNILGIVLIILLILYIVTLIKTIIYLIKSTPKKEKIVAKETNNSFKVDYDKYPVISKLIEHINKKIEEPILLNNQSHNIEEGNAKKDELTPRYYEVVDDELYMAVGYNDDGIYIVKCNIDKDSIDILEDDDPLQERIYDNFRKSIGKPTKLSNGMPLDFEEHPLISKILYTLETKEYIPVTFNSGDTVEMKAVSVLNTDGHMYILAKFKDGKQLVYELNFEVDGINIIKDEGIIDTINVIYKDESDDESEQTIESKLANSRKKIKWYQNIALIMRQYFADKKPGESNKPALITSIVVSSLFLVAGIVCFIMYFIKEGEASLYFLTASFVLFLPPISFLLYLPCQNPGGKLSHTARTVLKVLSVILLCLLCGCQIYSPFFLPQLYSVVMFATYLYGYIVICKNKSNSAYITFAFTPIIALLLVVYFIILFFVEVVKIIIEYLKESQSRFDIKYTIYDGGFERTLTYRRYIDGEYEYEYIDEGNHCWYTKDEPGSSNPTFYKKD